MSPDYAFCLQYVYLNVSLFVNSFTPRANRTVFVEPVFTKICVRLGKTIVVVTMSLRFSFVVIMGSQRNPIESNIITMNLSKTIICTVHAAISVLYFADKSDPNVLDRIADVSHCSRRRSRFYNALLTDVSTNSYAPPTHFNLETRARSLFVSSSSHYPYQTQTIILCPIVII